MYKAGSTKENGVFYPTITNLKSPLIDIYFCTPSKGTRSEALKEARKRVKELNSKL